MSEPGITNATLTERLICARNALIDGGRGRRFGVEYNGRNLAAFVIAFQGTVHAYLNQCPHRGTELDWQPGELFDESGKYLVCATHGATFEADSGECVVGPCRGLRLQRIAIEMIDGNVVLPPTQGRLVRAG